MADNTRIEELRRRVQRDPASIAFAQLAEEYRRAGRYKEAIETCEQGLAHHPGYLSARVTLGRSYLEINELDAAQLELKQVLRAAPENLAALRGMAEIHHRRGELQEALSHYRTALEFARNDPELQHLVGQISKELEPQPAAPAVADGMSFEDVKNTFLNLSLPEDQPAPAAQGAPAAVGSADPAPSVPTIDLTAATADEPFPWPVHDDATAAVPEPPVPVAVEDSTRPVLESAAPAAVDTTTHVEDVATPAPHEEPVSQALPEPAVSEIAAFPEPAVMIEAAPAVELAALALPMELLPPSSDVPVAHPTLVIPPQPSESAGEQPDPGAQVDALERWLETIIADRQRRA